MLVEVGRVRVRFIAGYNRYHSIILKGSSCLIGPIVHVPQMRGAVTKG